MTKPSDFPFGNWELPIEERIDDLIARMTTPEKISCLGPSAAVPRLGLSGTFHVEGLHGLAEGGPSNWGRLNPTPTTQFPQAYGLGSTWDPDIVRAVAAQEAEEARYLFQHPRYLRAGLVVRAPNADLARDPRWGRTEEVYGEDPFHTGTLAAAFVRGLQGSHPRYWTTAAILKHFLANSNEDDRKKSSSDFDERLWHEYYAKPFEIAVVQGGAQAMMAAYNAINGVPAHVHPALRSLVMRRWGLSGIICTDAQGLRLLVSDHKAFPDLASAAAACIKAGINHFIDAYVEPVTEALARNLCSEGDIDLALRGVFRVMCRLGLLDPPERVPHSRIGASAGVAELEPWNRPETRALVRLVTQKSIVLLKNSAKLLPFDRSRIQSLAVIGPRANSVLSDWYSGSPPYAISARDGIERVALGADGVTRLDAANQGMAVSWLANMSELAIELARQRDAVVVCVGNHPEGNASWRLVRSPSEGKEAVDRREIALQADQEDFIRRVQEANPNTVIVLMSSFPYALPWAAKHATTLLHITHASQELGTALADVLFGKANPGGKLAQTWPDSLDQLPAMMDYDIRHGRTYLYFKGQPQFAFGFGLSYTRFELSELTIAPTPLRSQDVLAVRVRVANVGERSGDEVVQVYVRHLVSRVDRPDRALKAFRRVTLAVGEAIPLELSIPARELSYWSPSEGTWLLEPGRIELLVGNSSRLEDLTLRRVIELAP